jgi:imidazolonepropionase-like amidohydrolase
MQAPGREPGTARTRRNQVTALRAAWLFDGISSALIPDPMVVMAGPTILGVTSRGRVPEGVAVVDLAGATLLPGLIDTHVHLAFDATPDAVVNISRRDDGELAEAMAQAGRTTLRGGITTVRDLGDRGYLSLALRGRSDQPTIVAAGPPITTPGGHCHFLGGETSPTTTGMRAVVREHAGRGVDIIKIMASGGSITPGSLQEATQFSTELLGAAVDEAHRLGLPVTAHAHATGAIANAVAVGVDGVEHVTFWAKDGVDAPADLIARIAAQRIVVGATLGLVPVPGMAPPPGVAARLPGMIANLRRLRDAGALMVAGTDAGIAPMKPHDVLRHTPAMLRQLGFSQAEALRTITSVAAGVCGLGRHKGRIAAGFDADILAVNGDPLADPDALHRIRAVYARGTLVPGTGTRTRARAKARLPRGPPATRVIPRDGRCPPRPQHWKRPPGRRRLAWLWQPGDVFAICR